MKQMTRSKSVWTKTLLTAILMIALSYATMAQVAVNKDGSTADGSAMLDVKATDAGFLPPRMTSTEMYAISNPAEGLIVYCTDYNTDGCLMVYSDAAWKCLFDGAGNYAPGATNVTQTGNAEVGETLTGSYTYTDSESDPEGTSTFQWYRADDATGTTNLAAITGATSLTYVLVTADQNKFVGFAVTPVAATGTSPGAEVITTSFAGPVTANQPPVASNVTFSGILMVGQVLSCSYLYTDNEGDPEGISTFQWFRADDASGTNVAAISGAVSQTYTLVAADDTKFISVEVTPVAQTGASPGIPVLSAYQGPVTANQPPVASNVSFNGNLGLGQVLTGFYTYTDNESDPEGISTYQWFRADDASGTNVAAISGATAITYTLQTADQTNFVSFEVTPVAQTGASPGIPVLSAYQGPVSDVSANYTPGFGTPDLITDGTYAAENTVWNDATVAVELNNTGTNFALTINLGSANSITRVKIQADCNDTYRIEYSTDNTNWTTLYNVPNASGSCPGLITRDSGVFTAVTMQFARIYAISGDGSYSVSEVQFF